MSGHKKDLGAFGENLACQFILKRGYTILARNFFCQYGELDIIAMHPSNKKTICCIEVKTRLTDQYGSPEEAITRDKIKKMRDSACYFFYHNKIEEKFFRLDAISILINYETKKARIKHLKNLSPQDLNYF